MSPMPNPISELVSLQFLRKPFAPDEVLYFYDGPVMMWLDTSHARYLAVALPADAGRWPFLLVELDDAAQAAVTSGSITARQAYTGPWPLYLVEDYGDLDDSPVMARRLISAPESWLPGDVPI